jgi:hypothetical protein
MSLLQNTSTISYQNYAALTDVFSRPRQAMVISSPSWCRREVHHAKLNLLPTALPLHISSQTLIGEILTL